MTQSRIKKTVFSFVMLALTWMVLELTAIAGYYIISRTAFSKSAFKDDMRSMIKTAETSQVKVNLDLWWGDVVEVIHPYLGFVLDPSRNEALPVSEFGFLSDRNSSPVMKKSPDKIIVGFFGGSFAAGVYQAATTTLKERLNAADKDVVLLNFSAGGYKQPQQLLILAYMLSLGAEFDVIINIDGFNEVALPPSENLPARVNPFYPRNWHTRTANIIDGANIRKLGLIESIKEQKSQWARFCFEHKLYRSPMCCMIWQYRDRVFERALYDAIQAIARSSAGRIELTGEMMQSLRDAGIPARTLAALKPLANRAFASVADLLEAVQKQIGREQASEYQAKILECAVLHNPVPYMTRGPTYKYGTELQLYTDLTEMWRQCSLQMHRLCLANGIAYYHAIQPNQYFEGSKPMTDIEKRAALQADHPYGRGVIKGYPLLIRAGENLREQGVNFIDLTMIFARTEEPLYSDTCCHLTLGGYTMIVDRLGEIIAGNRTPAPATGNE